MNSEQPVNRIKIRSGLNIPLKGRPEQQIYPGPEIQHVALCGPDYTGLRPRILVREGESVRLGQPLFIDKRDPTIPYTSPGSGTVVAINRGARRVLESVVIRLNDGVAEAAIFEPLDQEDLARLERVAVVERLQESGLWTTFRTRPFSRVPLSESIPDAIFVTAIDTRPLAPNPDLIIRGEEKAFADGLAVLTCLPKQQVFLCTGPDWPVQLPMTENVQRTEFSGPHPAGLPGTHIHFLYPVSASRTVWQVGYQDVIAIGKLFRKGEICTQRIVSLGGDRAATPRLLATRRGASIEELTAGEIVEADSCRIIGGSVLDGRTAVGGLAYLGRFHQQVSVIGEGGDRHFLGWTGLFPRRYSAARTFLKMSGHRNRHFMSTAQNGRYTGMLPTRAFEKVMPLDILPSPLLRALLVKDTDQAQALGCLELAEEDLALCSFVCPAKNAYGMILRLNLDQIERDG